MDELTSTIPFLSGRTRARVAMFLLLAYIFAALISIFSSYLQINLLSDALAGVEITETQAAANDALIGLTSVFQIALYIASAVAFSFWIHRAYRNLPALGNPPQRLEFSPAWAVGSFFIPFMNLIYPFRVTREIWNKSDPGVHNMDELVWQSAGSPPLLIIWWAMWLAANLAGQILYRLAGGANTADTLLWVTKLAIITDVLGIAAALLAVLVVRGIDARQEARRSNVHFLDTAPPPPPLYTQAPLNAEANR